MLQHSLQIFCDFDGTITVGDTVDQLLEALASDEWRDLEALWVDGKISTRDCMSRQVALIKGGWPAVEDVLRTVRVDEGLASLVSWCRESCVPFSIVSDGLDRVIQWLLARQNVRVDRIWANRLHEMESGQLSLEFPVRSHRFVCSTGYCKCQILDLAGSAAYQVVIGDGRSDFCWAGNADLVFAKGQLLKHCQAKGIVCEPYVTLDDVRRSLQVKFGDLSAYAVA